jgi:hypothetical protein
VDNSVSPIYDLAALQSAIAGGCRPEYLLFWGHTPKGPGVGRHVLSQWWPAAFIVDGTRYASAEHYMMAAKARLFGDEATHAEVLTASTPAEAKALGRRVRGFDEQTWERSRFALVVAASTAKFGQNPDLGTYLAETGDAVLVEASPVDRIWGIGLAAGDPRALQPAHWNGLNLLGFALMRARAQLRDGRKG